MAFKKGSVPWNKGIKGSTGKYWIGKKRPEIKTCMKTYEKGHIPWNKGKTGVLSLENRRKISE